MCLAIPTLIKSIDGQNAQVELSGIQRTISLALTPEAKVGDYVIVHTGFALSVLDKEEAELACELIKAVVGEAVQMKTIEILRQDVEMYIPAAMAREKLGFPQTEMEKQLGL